MKYISANETVKRKIKLLKMYSPLSVLQKATIEFQGTMELFYRHCTTCTYFMKGYFVNCRNWSV